MQQLAPAITALLAPLGSTAPQSTAPHGPDPTLVLLGGAAHDPCWACRSSSAPRS